MRMTGALRFLFALLLLCLPFAAQAHKHYPADGDPAALASVSVADLPAAVRTTLSLIKRGGPFPFPRDGIVFGNYEHRLPRQPCGYYREYTVPTPGARNRGARRVICGPLPECYYSGDHYRTFERIRE